MNKNEIKKRTHELYKVIRNAEKELKQIRSQCKHEKFAVKPYMWAPGHICDQKICDYCGEALGSPYEETFKWNCAIIEDKHE